MKKNKFIYDRVLTYLQKNRDYGNSVDKTRLLIGADADLVRMADKIHRIENLMMTNDAKVAESIEDTIFDLINYMAIYQSGEGHDCIETLSSTLRLIDLISEVQDIVSQPEVEFKNLQAKLTKEILSDFTMKYIVDYIQVCVA